GEARPARDDLLQVPGRERVIASLEVLSSEGDQLPQLVVRAHGQDRITAGHTNGDTQMTGRSICVSPTSEPARLPALPAAPRPRAVPFWPAPRPASARPRRRVAARSASAAS